MKLLKGADITATLNEKLKEEISHLNRVPHLALIRIGERKDDISYERGAKKRMETIGISFHSYAFPLSISKEAFFHEFRRINQDPSIDGILLLRPLPPQIEESEIAGFIDPLKDVDGISPVNLAKIFSGDETGFAPCTAEAVIEMLHFTGISMSGKHAVIIGRSLVIGKPLSMLLLKENCTVTICHSRTIDLPKICKEADILIACAGKAKMINASYLSEQALVIDVGIHVQENGKLCGDVDLNALSDTQAYVTPVPGGVGTVTTSILAKHVIEAAKRCRI